MPQNSKIWTWEMTKKMYLNKSKIINLKIIIFIKDIDRCGVMGVRVI